MANEKTEQKDKIVGSTGNRYSENTKKEAVKFLESSEEHGKIKLTQAKFGVSYIALRKWVEKYGTSEKKVRKSKSSKKETSKEVGKRGRKANPSTFVLRQLAKMKTQAERNVKFITKAMEKISAK